MSGRKAIIVSLFLFTVLGAGCSMVQTDETTTVREPTVENTAETIETTTVREPTVENTTETIELKNHGQLLVVNVSTVPEGATVVPYANSTVPDSQLLESGFNQSTKEGWSTEIAEAQLQELEAGLSDVPRYGGDRAGYYVRFDGSVYQVRVLVYA